MNIQQAKDEIKRSVSIYLMKDEFGNYRIPLERQRPLFMIGAPGIGKTAVMAQIARELDISLVSYSMTHHTRQSALGLPFIVKENYQGREFDVSKYTLSEILATVYENMEQSGKKEGILFLDEINCVSETLGPSMLQFLQYKTFGNHRLPDGWVVVTAGNPAEYNKSVHEFDVATLDRLKVLHVEPDYGVWKQYAERNNLHHAVTSYLDIHEDDFYHIETTIDGKSYVTARGWEDLSEAICLYEEKGYPVDETMVHEYLADASIAQNFAGYYELYSRYRSDYKIRDILKGQEDPAILERARNAGFDERISVSDLLMEAILPRIRTNMETEDALRELLPSLRKIKQEYAVNPSMDLKARLKEIQNGILERMKKGEASRGLSDSEKRRMQYEVSFLNKCMHAIDLSGDLAFTAVMNLFNSAAASLKEEAASIKESLHSLFTFAEKAFGEGEEILLIVTELTASIPSARFIAEYGCEDYYKYSRALQMDERSKDLMKQLKEYEDIVKKQGEVRLA